MLAQKNHHPRDDKIVFKEEGHLYTYDSTCNFTSVTTVIHHFFPKFDADKIIDKMMNSTKWPKSKYFGMSKDEIKEQWSNNGKKSSELGTLMHAAIEDFYNGTLDKDPDTPEFQQFKCFWNGFQKKNPTWTPFRTEWVVYDEDKHLAGSIDMVFGNTAGDIVLFDWKRSKEIKRSNHWQKGSGPFSHLDDCNFNHYTLQLNIYRHILESKYGKKVIGMYLVVCHPSQSHPQIINVPKLHREISQLWTLLPLKKHT